MTSDAPLIPGCPHCASKAAPLPWAVDARTGARTYKCRECQRAWSVDGVQQGLPLEGPVAADLALD